MVVDELSSILKKERASELIPFLRKLTKEEHKQIAASLKEFAKEYLEFRQETSLFGAISFKQKGTNTQQEILYATAFFCLNRKEFQKYDRFGSFLSSSIVYNILPYYCPAWFSDFVNDLTKQNWLPWNVDYRFIMNLTEKGYLIPSDELISRLIPQMIFDRDENRKVRYVPANLEKWSITLEKHIWLIFQFETDIHFSDRYHQVKNSTKDFRHWIEALRDYAGRGLLDRERLLQEALLATGRNFNKSLSGWFVDLFKALDPTREEYLILQAELFSTLSSQHSKAVDAAISGIREIIDHKQFQVEVFLDHIPVLLASVTKAVVVKTISLLEKIIRLHPSFKEQACLLLTQAFIHNNEEIQNKAATILMKHSSGITQSLHREIALYSESILMSSKTILAGLITDATISEIDENSPVQADANESSSPIEIEKIKSVDQLVFLASQAFDNNDPFHFELLAAALVDLQDEIDGNVLHKFEPALQRAYSVVINDWPSTMGYLDHMLATFFIDTTKIFIARYPRDGASLQSIHKAFKKKEADNKAKWSWYTTRILEFLTWSTHSKDTTYIIHKTILINAYQHIRDQVRLPLLSTPTHYYGLLDPIELVKRLAMYQQANELPDNFDLQLALVRIAPFHRSEAIRQIKDKLTGELTRILEFAFDPHMRPTPPFDTPSIWFMAGVAKAPSEIFPEFRSFPYSKIPPSTFTGVIPWRSFREHYQVTRYNFDKKQNEQVPAEQNVLRLTLNPPLVNWGEAEKKEQNILSRLARFIPFPKKAKEEYVENLYEFLSLKAKSLSAEHNDVQRFLYLFPSNPNPMLAQIAAAALEHSTFFSETDKRIVTKTIEALTNLSFDYTEMTYLFIGTCMLTSDKTIRSFAAEMWIRGVNHSKINSAEIGRITGIHITGGYAPMKRLTDLISTNLLKISRRHNEELQSMITSLIEHINIDPPSGTKNLLELYREVILLTRSPLESDQVKNKLKAWAAVPSLKKVVHALLNTNEAK